MSNLTNLKTRLNNIDRILGFNKKVSELAIELSEDLCDPSEGVLKDILRMHHTLFGILVEALRQADEEVNERSLFEPSDDDDKERVH